MCFYPNQLPIGILELGRFLVRYQTDSYYRHHGCLETTFNSIFLCTQKKKKNLAISSERNVKLLSVNFYLAS